MRSLAIGALMGLFRSADAMDKSMTAAGATVKVKGQSGKMTLTLPGVDEKTPGTEVNCEISALRQLDADGKTLGSGGSSKHSFNSFATQDFTFSEPESAKYQNIDVTKVTFESTLVGKSNIKIEVMIFQKDGSIAVGEDTQNVTQGAVKFNVVLGEWSWCGEDGVTCVSASGVGASVELDITVAGKNAPSKDEAAKTAGTAFNMGGSQIVMFNTYSPDSGKTFKTMPSGYPKVSGPTFTLKFPKWTGTLMYDPLVSKSTDTGSISSAPTAGPLLALLAMAAGLAFRG